MNKRKTGRGVVPIECFISTASKAIPLDTETGGLALPCEGFAREAPGGPVTYGQYLGAVERFFSENSHRALRSLLKRQTGPTPAIESASAIELTSEKHGALYSVSRLRVRFDGAERSFAVNCAFSAEQQAFLQVEARLLAGLNRKFALPYLPTPFLRAKTSPGGHPSDFGLMLLITGWFENHHEFHLSRDASGASAIRVWDPARTQCFLSGAEAVRLYEQASAILTSYLDTRSFSQIHPWHHAAGDFVTDSLQAPPNLRLITVRGYRPLLAAKSARGDKMLGALHFFVNLGIRMRIDRLDGTGDLAWAGAQSLEGVIAGFTQVWKTRSSEDASFPKAGEIFSLFLDFSPDERLAFAEIAAMDGRVEADETDFLLSHLPSHVSELSDALKNFGF